MLILNPCPSWELQEMCNTCRKKRRDETAGQKDQYHAKKRSSSEAETCIEETILSLAERSEDKESETEVQKALRSPPEICSLP